MFDKGKVILGILLFLALTSFPIWYNIATGTTDMPELEKPVKGERCVAETEYMRASHMDLLNQWRDDVVRTGNRIHIAQDGTKYIKSLTQTCLDCHSNTEGFCDRCHSYMAVEPYCWDCHIIPKETD